MTALFLLAFLAAGQEPDTLAPRLAEAEALLDSCARAAREERKGAAVQGAERAEAAFTALARLRPRDPEPLVGQARTLSQCRLPVASVLRKGGLYRRSTEILERALALDSTHWGARYALALGHFHAPGHADDAEREFEILLRRQGDAASFPEQAAPYAYLGDLYVRQGRREDALAVWRRGAVLFPDDARLKRRLEQSHGVR